MRFRGKMTDISSIQLFTKIVNTVAKLAKSSVTVRISESHVYLVMKDRVSTSAIIWCEMQQGYFFDEYNMEGVSAEYNEIYLDLALDLLMKALKSAQSAKSLKIRLTNKQRPCLTLEVELPSLVSSSRIVVHDVPVRVIPRRLWDEYDEPEMAEFQISIFFPPLKTLRNVVDRMKNLSSFVVISATPDGEMVLKVETNMVVVSTHFRDLEIPTEINGQEIQQNEGRESEVRVDIRKINLLLSSPIIPTRVICNIVHHRMLHLFFLHEDVSLQYILPAVTS